VLDTTNVKSFFPGSGRKFELSGKLYSLFSPTEVCCPGLQTMQGSRKLGAREQCSEERSANIEEIFKEHYFHPYILKMNAFE